MTTGDFYGDPADNECKTCFEGITSITNHEKRL